MAQENVIQANVYMFSQHLLKTWNSYVHIVTPENVINLSMLEFHKQIFTANLIWADILVKKQSKLKA